MGHVLLDQFLPVGADVTGGAVVAGRRQAVVGPEKGDFTLINIPADDPGVIDVDQFSGADATPKNETEEKKEQNGANEFHWK
jgi:hypothetical protein